MSPIRSRSFAFGRLLGCTLALLLGGVAFVHAAGDPFDAKKNSPAKEKEPPTAKRISFEVVVSPKTVKRGETTRVTITGTLRPGFHTYPITQRTPTQLEAQLSKIRFTETAGLKPLPPLTESEPEFVKEDDEIYLEYTKPFTWSQDILVLRDATPGPKKLPFRIKIQVCDRTCVRGEHDLDATFDVAPGEPAALTADLEKRLKSEPPEIKVVEPPGSAASTDSLGTPKATSGLWAFVMAGVFWGAVSLVTPCVFPMIPITVSVFLKHSEKDHHRPITTALVYCVTIVVVLTVAAVTLLSVFRELSNSRVMNFALGGLFIFFALSLFGMYEIELPRSLARYTDARAGRGGLLGTVFMALTFTIVSFACVAPFLGGFGGTSDAATMGWAHRLLGGLAFSVTFAAPFFVLALFPNLLRKLPKSGNWLNSVKVVMGFLELAAALKFLRAGELVLSARPAFLTYEMVLGLYIAICVLCGLYLLNVYRLPHDTPSEHLNVPQLLLSAVFLGLALYLTPALFKQGSEGNNQRPAGTIFAWLDSFLLPDDGRSDLPWTADLKKGLDDALVKNQLVFVDFTGMICTNCKLNEKNVFPIPEVKDLMKRYALVKLYTDRVPNDLYPLEQQAKFGDSLTRQREDAQENLVFQRKTFDTEQLPLYVILKPLPGGKYQEVSRYAEGKINSEAEFAAFLRKPLGAEASRAEAAAQQRATTDASVRRDDKNSGN